MTRQRCEEIIRGRRCNLPAAWLVGISDDGLYPACDQHARAWAADCRHPLHPGETPIQQAIALTLGAYQAALALLTLSEADVLRDVLASRIAKDWLRDTGHIGDERSREEAA